MNETPDIDGDEPEEIQSPSVEERLAVIEDHNNTPTLSMRDIFAAFALAGDVADGIRVQKDGSYSETRVEQAARRSYSLADAMLRERSKYRL